MERAEAGRAAKIDYEYVSSLWIKFGPSGSLRDAFEAARSADTGRTRPNLDGETQPQQTSTTKSELATANETIARLRELGKRAVAQRIIGRRRQRR
jgi:hypothetical protein